MEHLGTGLALDQASAIVQGRMERHPGGPKCQGPRVVRNGQADGLCSVTSAAVAALPSMRSPARRWHGCAIAANGLSKPRPWTAVLRSGGG